jgi:hypothetical protein
MRAITYKRRGPARTPPQAFKQPTDGSNALQQQRCVQSQGCIPARLVAWERIPRWPAAVVLTLPPLLVSSGVACLPQVGWEEVVAWRHTHHLGCAGSVIESVGQAANWRSGTPAPLSALVNLMLMRSRWPCGRWRRGDDAFGVGCVARKSAVPTRRRQHSRAVLSRIHAYDTRPAFQAP